MAQLAPTSAGKLWVLVGPAGAGKTTLAHRLIAADPRHRAFSVSHTTRPMRATETDHVDYHFVSRPDFEALRAGGGLAEWAEVHGNFYGTSKDEIEHKTTAGRDLIFDIDIEGARNLAAAFPRRTRLFFILPPSWAVLVARLERRGSETEATLRRRLRTARAELEALWASPLHWRLLCNDDLEVTDARLQAAVAGPWPPPRRDSDWLLVESFVTAARADSRTAPLPA